GELVYTAAPMGEIVGYAYNADGTVATSTQYATRLTASQVAALTAATVIATTTADETTTSIYNGDGELVYVASPMGEIVGYTYNADGTVATTTQYATRLTASQVAALTATSAIAINVSDETAVHIYNAAGEEVYSVSPLGEAVGYTYNADGTLVTTTQY